MKKIRPFLKWAGSKYNCLEKIIPLLPHGKRLIEPFAGSGAIFMNAEYPSYLLAESNQDLITLFNSLKQQGESFIQYCQNYFQPEFNNKEVYLTLRADFNGLKNSNEKSALFLYLNRHGYNGLCRYNSSGLFNVPFGQYIKPYFPLEEMRLFCKKSQEAEFMVADFRKSFEQAEPGDIIYCDPPYVPVSENAKPFPYTQKKFEIIDQIELAELARETASKGIPVILSNHDTEFTRHHYKQAKIRSFTVSRTISCLGDKRQPIKELLAIFK